ncbi:MAG: signal peptidase I [Patescibacteria group bacterium]
MEDFKIAGIIVILYLTSLLVGLRFYTITSGSMGELLPIGSLVIAYPGKVEKGRLVAFKSPKSQEVIIHRVVGVTLLANEQHFVTKGDINPVLDPWLLKNEEIEGVVLVKIPLLGYMLNTLRN